MSVIDAQVHVWSQGDPGDHHRQTPITVEVLRQQMAQAGVDRVLLVPPLWDPGGNAYSLAAAQRYPDQFAVMGLLPLEGLEPAQGSARILAWKLQRGMVGLRFLFNSPERIAPLSDGSFEWVWPAAEEAGLAVALLVPNSLEVVADIATRYPRLQLIVDHLGVPRGARGPGAFEHLPQLLELSRFPNVAVKAIGVGDYAHDPFPFRSLEEPLRRVFDAFGPHRILWGSDLSRLKHPYRECVEHFATTLPWLSDQDRALVMGLNVGRITGWQAPKLNPDQAAKQESMTPRPFR
jgi:L-fuconolactonase